MSDGPWLDYAPKSAAANAADGPWNDFKPKNQQGPWLDYAKSAQGPWNAYALHDRAPLQADVLHDRPPLDASAEERLPFANQTYEQEARDPRRPMMNRVGAALATEGYNLANAPFQATQRLLGGIRQGEGLSSNPASVPNAPAQAGDAFNAAQFGMRAHPEMAMAGRPPIEPFRSGDIPKLTPELPKYVQVRPTVADIAKAAEWPGTPNRAAEAGQAAVGKVADRAAAQAPKEKMGFTELPPGTKAPQSVTTEPPALRGYVNTRGKGTQFHGAPSPVADLNEGHYGSPTSIYGTQGLYTTDAMDIAHGYANKKGAGAPSFYEAVPKGPQHIYDMDGPVDATIARRLWTMANEKHGDTGGIVEEALGEDPKSLRELFDTVRGIAREERIPANEIQEGVFHPLADALEDMGYTGMRHEGGGATKSPAHNVVIYFSPHKNVSLRSLSSDEIDAMRAKGADSPSPQAPEREAPEVKSEPRSVGAAASPPPVVPALPDKGMRQTAKTLSDDLHRLERKHDDVKIGALQAVRELPPEAVKLKEKFFDYLEPGGKKPVLTEDEQAVFDKTLAPWLEKQKDLYAEIKKAAPDLLPKDYDPDYVHHLVKGRVPEFDEPLGEITREGTYPYMGAKTLPKSTRSLKSSRYYAIEDAKGNRQTVMLDDKGNLYLMQGKKPINIPAKDIDGDVEPGKTFDISGKPWTLKRAAVHEKEDATNLKYYKDAYAATLSNVVRLEKVADALHFFETMKKDPEFLQGAWRPGDTRPIPKDARPTTLPGWEGWRFEPRLAEVMDDWHNKPGEAWTENLRKLNHAVLGTLFLLPFRHMGNVGAHWYVGRGWDWLNPVADARMAKDTTAALFDTLKQGPMTRQMLREGSALQYPRVANQDFYAKMLKGLGEDMKAGKYDNIFQRVGLKPKEFYDGWLKASSAAMWSFNDVLMQSRVRELTRKGMSMPEAIAAAEKDIPNYRINSRVAMDNQAGRAISRYLQNSLFSSFGRYGNNKWRAIADMAKDIAKGKTGQERIDAVGKFVALASLVYFLSWPIDTAIKKLTGKNDKRSSPIGPASVVDTLKKAGELAAPETMKRLGATDEEVAGSQLFQSTIELSPLVDQGVTQATGRNPYTGQNVQTPGERVQSIAGQANPVAVGSELASGRASPTEEILKATIGERGTPKRPPARVLSQQERQREIAEGRQPINRMISRGERALKPFTPDAIVNWLLRQGPAP